jgi:hypothetical protein
MMHKRIFGPELLIRTPVFLVQYNVWGDHKEGGSYVETELVAVEQERQTFDYGGMVKMAVGALVAVVLVLVLLQLLELT